MSQRIVVIIAGEPSWADGLQGIDGLDVRHYTDTDRTVARLTDDRAALVLVDGAGPHWAHFTATPKTSPATRRVPVFVVTEDAAVREAAPTTGADLVVTREDLLADAAAFVRRHARRLDPAHEEQLGCECAEPLPPLAVAGVQKFNNREFYPQHDLFEEQWMKTDGPVRDLYRAVLQVGVAYYQVERGNYRGARKMLLRAVQWLEALPDVCQTIDVAQLRADAYRVREVLEATDPADIDDFDRSLLKPVRLIET